MNDDFNRLLQIHSSLRTNWLRYKPLWDDIANVCALTVDPDYMWTNQNNKSRDLDEYVDDPTAAISVNQAGDYLIGIMWGTGEGVFDLIPSRYVTELVDAQVVKPWFDFATSQTLYHMNHENTGYQAALRPYAYDQFSFGTSGIGIFKNAAFTQGIEENALIARNYGIDNTCIDEGKNGAPDIGETVYHWTLARIIGEFCTDNGSVNMTKLKQMPDSIQKAWKAADYNQEFDLIFMWLPRDDWDPKLKGKRGARYRGVWFMETDQKNGIFCEDSFSERPINMARAIRVRGEKYGRSPGTMLISTIRSMNFMFAITAEILEKMANPALGAFGNSIFGDNVLDSSPNGLTIFNQTQTNGQPPVFPIHDVGDPSGIIKFLLPYMENKVTTGFKIDALLDSNNEGSPEMSATESLQRYNIRGKSLSGMLGLQKAERMVPDAKRSVSCLWDMGELGVNPKMDAARAQRLMSVNKSERIIPEQVLAVVAKGRPWYEIRWNNELEKLIRTQEVQALTQILQAVTAIAALYPDIIHAIKWYDLLKALNDSLDYNNQILVTANEFKKIIADAAKVKQQAMQLQAAQAAGAAQSDQSTANKNNAQAQGMLNNGQAKLTNAF